MAARWPLIGQWREGVVGLADQRGEFPVAGGFVVSKDVHPSIVGIEAKTRVPSAVSLPLEGPS